MSKESAHNAGDPADEGLIPASGRSSEKEMATHSSILAWEIPWTEEPVRLQSMGLPRVRHNLASERALILYLKVAAAAAAKSLQSCPTLSDPMDCSLPGSSIHGIFQTRVLEWGAIAFFH